MAQFCTSSIGGANQLSQGVLFVAKEPYPTLPTFSLCLSVYVRRRVVLFKRGGCKGFWVGPAQLPLRGEHIQFKETSGQLAIVEQL